MHIGGELFFDRIMLFQTLNRNKFNAVLATTSAATAIADLINVQKQPCCSYYWLFDTLLEVPEFVHTYVLCTIFGK